MSLTTLLHNLRSMIISMIGGTLYTFYHRNSFIFFSCSLPRRLPIHPQRPSQSALLHSHLSQPQNPHWLPHSHRASSWPISAPHTDSALRPQPTAASPAGGKGVSAECQIAQRVEVWRAWQRRRRLGCLPSQQRQETEAHLRQCRGAQGCQAAEAPSPKSHQRLAASWPALSEEGFLSGTW